VLAKLDGEREVVEDRLVAADDGRAVDLEEGGSMLIALHGVIMPD
jgi:hypothetical protein